MIAFESHHGLKHRTQGWERYVALKLDMSKLYNRLEWNFIIMLAMGFSVRWVEMILHCVWTVYYYVLHEGEESLFSHRNY